MFMHNLLCSHFWKIYFSISSLFAYLSDVITDIIPFRQQKNSKSSLCKSLPIVFTCRYPPVCTDADIIRKGVEEGQMAVRRAITPYAGIVPPTASSITPESSKASEAQSLQSLESPASCDLDSSLDSDEDVVQVRHSVL